MTAPKPGRTWTEVGAAYSDEDNRPGVEKEIDSLPWQPPTGSFPMSPGLALKEIVKGFRLPNVSQVAISREGMLLGVEWNQTAFGAGRYRIYVMDTGTTLIPVATDYWPEETSAEISAEG